jgi:F-type H+-transporting ATPase subunit b
LSGWPAEWYKFLFVFICKDRRVIPDLSVVWVIAFVLALTVALDRLLLRPLTKVMQAREGAITSARELAETSRARAVAATEEFESKTREARNELYKQMDEKRRGALAARTEILASTRREVEKTAGEATARLDAQVTKARAELDRDATSLAATIVERVLGRKAS